MARPWRSSPATWWAIPSAATCCRSCTGWPACASSATTWSSSSITAGRTPAGIPLTKTLSDDPSYGLGELTGTPSGSGCAGGASSIAARALSRPVAGRDGGALRERRRPARAVDGHVARRVRRVPPPDLHRHRSRASRSSAMSPGVRASLAYASPVDFHEHYTYGTRIGQAGLSDPDARHRRGAAAPAGGARPAAGAVHARGASASPR